VSGTQPRSPGTVYCRRMDSAEQVDRFWQVARARARLTAMPGYFGPTALESVPPPTWTWGEVAGEADAFVARAIADGEVETSAPLAAYDDGERPTVGALSILCDGADRPRALLSTSEVHERGDELVERSTVIYSED
jgi:hypothetical protein